MDKVEAYNIKILQNHQKPTDNVLRCAFEECPFYLSLRTARVDREKIGTANCSPGFRKTEFG
jgi:hypothetical protein